MNWSHKGFHPQNLSSILYEYSVKMDHVAENGTINMTHFLTSEYKMIPQRQSKHASIFDAKYEIVNMFYTPSGKKTIEWLFVKGKWFSSVLFNMSQESAADYYLKEGKGILDGQWETINELFAMFPKLPVTGLVHAYVYDIIGMDQILSHIVSSSNQYLDFGDKRSINSLDHKSFDISTSLYDADSNYQNGDMKAGYLGEAVYHDRKTEVFCFSCDNASFRMSVKNKEKTGFSYYRGNIAIEYETGILYGADMTEYIFSGNNQLLRREMIIKTKEINSL